MNRGVFAAANYGMSLPAAKNSYGVVGYCWGGSATFNHAVFNGKRFDGGVVYYGTSAAVDSMPKIKAPVLGLYGGNDARVNATIGWADTTMRSLKKSYTYRKILTAPATGSSRAGPARQPRSGQAGPAYDHRVLQEEPEVARRVRVSLSRRPEQNEGHGA